MASKHDLRKGAKAPEFKQGDYVRILLPNRAHKLSPSYSEPTRVSKANDNTVWLENGQRWNVRRGILHTPKGRSPHSTPASKDQSNQQHQLPPQEIDDDDTDEQNERWPFNLNVEGAHTATNATRPIQQERQAGSLPRRSARVSVPKNYGPFIRY
jgi:hypothetical protein